MSTNTASFVPASSRSTSTAKRSIHDYDDIIDVVYPFSNHQHSDHPHVDPETRAAEFAPFAALTNYHETIGSVEDENLANSNANHFQYDDDIVNDPELPE